MALDKTGLKTAILSLLNNMAVREDHPETAREDFATQLSEAFDAYVRTGQVEVTTTGSASTQHGTGTIT